MADFAIVRTSSTTQQMDDLVSLAPSQVPVPISPSSSTTSGEKSCYTNAATLPTPITSSALPETDRSSTSIPLSLSSPRHPPSRPPRPRYSLPNLRPTIILSPRLALRVLSHPVYPSISHQDVLVSSHPSYLLLQSDGSGTRKKSFSEDVFSSLSFYGVSEFDNLSVKDEGQRKSLELTIESPARDSISCSDCNIDPRRRSGTGLKSDFNSYNPAESFRHEKNAHHRPSFNMLTPLIESTDADASISPCFPKDMTTSLAQALTSTSPIPSESTTTTITNEKQYTFRYIAFNPNLEAGKFATSSRLKHKWHNRNRRIQWLILTMIFVVLVSGGITAGVVWKLAQI